MERVTGKVVSVEVRSGKGKRQKLLIDDWKIRDHIKCRSVQLNNFKSAEPPRTVILPPANGNVNEVHEITTKVAESIDVSVPASIIISSDRIEPLRTAVQDRLWTSQKVDISKNDSTAQISLNFIAPANDVIVQNYAHYSIKPMDFFMLMFPQKNLFATVALTNERSEKPVKR